MIHARECAAGLLLAAGLFGCQARQMVSQYASFDAVVTDLYDKHVLYNLARRDAGRTMVQMNYQSFHANLTYSMNVGANAQFYANTQNVTGVDSTKIPLYTYQQQSFGPNLSNNTTSGLAINSAPAGEQEAIRALYEEQVSRPDEERIYQRTTHVLVAMRSYCWVRTAQGDLYFVPAEKQREFSDFVHRVSFYKPGAPGQAGAMNRPGGKTADKVTR